MRDPEEPLAAGSSGSGPFRRRKALSLHREQPLNSRSTADFDFDGGRVAILFFSYSGMPAAIRPGSAHPRSRSQRSPVRGGAQRRAFENECPRLFGADLAAESVKSGDKILEGIADQMIGYVRLDRLCQGEFLARQFEVLEKDLKRVVNAAVGAPSEDTDSATCNYRRRREFPASSRGNSESGGAPTAAPSC